MLAVSVGEFLSVLDLIGGLVETGAQVLATTTTSSAVDFAAQRLPDGVIHQFSPLDTPQATQRFLDHWAPDLAVFVESDIWPNQIVMTRARSIPLALINARLSASSLKQWYKRPDTARTLFSRFDRIMTQTEATRATLQALGARPDRLSVTGDMKTATAAQPVDVSKAQALERDLKERPLWVANSSHDGEESQISAAHRIVTGDTPDAYSTSRRAIRNAAMRSKRCYSKKTGMSRAAAKANPSPQRPKSIWPTHSVNPASGIASPQSFLSRDLSRL